MTKKRNLTTFMIAIMIILFSLPANAQGKVGYAKWDELNTTLTFYGGESVPDGAFELNTGEEFPGWGCDPHCSKVVFDESFKDVRPTSCFRWFGGSWGLTTIEGIENLNTEEVTNMSGMFYDCQSLTSLDLSSFNTAKVTNMDDMFISCSSLTSLDLSSFNTAKVENMSDMFWGCSGLTSLDLSSFNTAEVTDMSNMFEDCSALTTIYVSDDFTTDNVSSSDYMFYNCSKLNNGNVSYSENNIGIEMAKCETGYFTKSNLTPYVKWNGDTKVLTFKVANYTTGTNGEYKLNEGNNEPGWLGLNFNCTKVVFTPSFKQAKPTSCYKWFSGFGLLTTIQGIENLNTEEVTNMSYMFDCCQGLTSLDLSSFYTANVKNMSYMFQLCPKLSSLDLSSFNTTKVSDMYAMFFGCSGLTSLDLSSFNTEEVTNMGYMFGSCSGLTSLDLFKFNTANVEDMSNMFNGCSGLTTINVSDAFTTNKVSESNDMFSSCSNLKGATSYDSGKTDKNMANFDGYFTPKIITPYVKWDANTKVLTFKVANTKEAGSDVYDLNEGANTPGWSIDEVKNYCTKVVFTSSFNHAKPTSCYKWFKDFGQLTTIQGIENLNTEEVKNMSEMFEGCKKLTSLKLSNFDTAKVTDMGYMFYDCSGLTSLDLSSFNTEEVTNMGFMFSNCSGLSSLDLSNFDTSKVTDMGFMFSNCSGLSSLDLSNFNTAKVENMYQMFFGLSLTSLDLSNFDTSNVTNMGSMFNGCSGLTSLNLSSFNTANVTSMFQMFKGCSGLESLNLSSFNTANVTKMDYMFNGCSSLTSLTLSSFNTDKVKNMKSMFNGCSGLTKIYVSDDFATGNVTYGSDMFTGCSKLVGAIGYDSGKTSKEYANYNTGYFKTYFTLGASKVELFGEQLTTDILDLSGDNDFVAHAPFTANEAKYSRDLSTSESTWFSLCLPFAYSPNNFTAYQLMSATDDAVEIGEISGEIVAGTPVLFKFKDGVKNEEKKINISANKADIVKAPVEGATVIDTDGSSLQLCGTYQAKTFSKDADGNAFILLNNKLMNPANMLKNENVTSVSVKPFRAYMTLTASAQTSSARAFSIGHGDEGNEGTAAIDLLNSVATDDAEYYDINGRRIDAPAKGVNIVRRGNKTIKLIIK